jgi:hypothetical protein
VACCVTAVRRAPARQGRTHGRAPETPGPGPPGRDLARALPSISHPFASLVVTFRFLEEINKLQPDDPWFARLRDAYLEPWGRGLAGTFALALRVGAFAHTFAWARQRDALPEEARLEFDRGFAVVLRRAVAQTLE